MVGLGIKVKFLISCWTWRFWIFRANNRSVNNGLWRKIWSLPKFSEGFINNLGNSNIKSQDHYKRLKSSRSYVRAFTYGIGTIYMLLCSIWNLWGHGSLGHWVPLKIWFPLVWIYSFVCFEKKIVGWIQKKPFANPKSHWLSCIKISFLSLFSRVVKALDQNYESFVKSSERDLDTSGKLANSDFDPK